MEPLPIQSTMGFARKLASPKKKMRDKAMSFLVVWLTSQKQLEEDELRKIWKGLFYCVWHSDKAPVQADLIQRLASILEKLDIGLALKFFKVFLTTMRREWAGIDRLRLDKFYLLLRNFLTHIFAALQKIGWHSGSTKEFMDMLLEYGFLAKDQYAASGINFHYADIYLQELEKFLPLRADTFRFLIEPFLTVCACVSDKSLRQKINDSIFNSLVDFGRRLIAAKQEGHPLDPVVETLGSLFLAVRLGSEAFKLASLPSTLQANRKILYAFYSEYDKLEKMLELSGIYLPLLTEATKEKKKKKKEKVLGPLCRVAKPRKKGVHKKVKGFKKGIENAFDEDSRQAFVFDKNKGSIVDFTNLMDGSKDFSENNEDDKGMQTNVREGNAVCVVEIKDKDKVAKRKVRSEKGKKFSLVETAASEDPHSASNGLGTDNLVMSKLEEQFDTFAGGASDVCITPKHKKRKSVSSRVSGKKKRKRMSLTEGIATDGGTHMPPLSTDVENVTLNAGTGESSSGKVKKVRFALKKNLVWTPSTPLPAGVVRIPPSATPRGSALKKGVPPGPIVSETANTPKQRKATLMWSSSPRKVCKVRKHVMDNVHVWFEQELKGLFGQDLKGELGGLLESGKNMRDWY